MKRRFRLRNSNDFKRVRMHGLSIAHPLVVLISLENNLEQFRVGVSAGKSVGNAVERNRAKRVIRAAFQALLKDLPKGYDFVCVARKPILKAKSFQVQQAVEQCLARMNGLPGNNGR